MSWFTALLASGPARKSLGLLLAALTIALFLFNLRRPADRDALADRLRDGRF